MIRLLFEIQYDGSDFHGWQRQNNVISIQQIIEESLEKLFQKRITVYGCGRTDAGVHASQYFFHINLEEIPKTYIQYKLNRMLPQSIVVKEIYRVNKNVHARFSAKRRSYSYNFHLLPDPFIDPFSTYYSEPIKNLNDMEKAMEICCSKTDFRYFCRTPDKHPSTICQVSSMTLDSDRSTDRYSIHISANRFLKSMVRILVHRLIQVGSGKMSIERFQEYFDGKHAEEQVILAPPQGLFLSQVEYNERFDQPLAPNS